MATEVKITASDATEFGKAVAISRDYAVIGARQPSSTSFLSPGAAYIFLNDGSNWTQQAKLTATTAENTEDEFGCAVAIDGDYVIVGAKYEGPLLEQGKAYIFHRNGSNWVQQAVLVASDPVEFGNFGAAVALSGEWATVASTEGAAYLFQRSGSTWTEKAKLTGGTAVSLRGNYTVVGAHIFLRSGATWQEQTVVTPSDPTPNNWFGSSVSISGNYFIVGAYGANAAYVFGRTGSQWNEQAKLQPSSNPLFGPRLFGQAVSISGDYAIVGNTGDDGGGSGAGAAFVFLRMGTAWLEVEKVIVSDAAVFDGFGTSVAIDGSVRGARAIVGAPHNKSGFACILSGFTEPFDPNRYKYGFNPGVLFGLVAGGPGMIWVPGVGPVPVPDPRQAQALPPNTRDVLLGLAISEAADLVHDGKFRQEVKAAGLRLMKEAASRLRIPPVADVAAILDELAKKNPEKLDWRRSVVDLMKLVGLESSLPVRKQLAKKLHYAGNINDSGPMNVWLHEQVLIKLAETNGKIPVEF
jgi:hypothetical protein